jgi:very-short-patch-repair endonuclease
MSKRDFFIEQARKVHGDKYDYSKVEYKRAHDKMCIICPKHGEFWQDKYTHLNGVGCPICAKENRPLKYTTEDFIEKCKKVWGNRYSYDNTVYNGIMNFVIITCPIHGDFEIRASDFLNGHGCQECGGVKRLTTEIFIDRARKVHGDLYDYSKVKYVNNKTEVCIICPKHGEFWQKPVLHLKGHGCPNCFKNFKKTTEQFINEAKQIHGDKYDYSKVNYQGNKKKVEIICQKHGSFFMTPLYHLQGHGCQKCYDERRGNAIRKSNETFIEELKDIYMGLNYDFSKVKYANSNTKVTIICPKHGEFNVTPNHVITRGDACPYCNKSHLERDVNTMLEKLGLLFIRQKRFDWLGMKSLDFYIPRYKLAIECQGEQHFTPLKYFGGEDKFIKQVRYDISKNVECEENGIKILYVASNKDTIDYLKPIYNGIYDNNLYEINELENIIRNYSK